MPKLTASKDKIEGLPPLPEGIYAFRLDGFKPAKASKGGSVNLNPIMKVINHPEYNDRNIFENLNTKGEWVWKDFCHALGVELPMDGADSYEFPGTFNCRVHGDQCPQDDPQNWDYTGPLLGQVGQCYQVQADNTRGGIINKTKYYVCKVPGCTLKHSKNLAGG